MFVEERCTDRNGERSLPEELFIPYQKWAQKYHVPAYQTKGAFVGALIDLGIASATMWLRAHSFQQPRVYSTVPAMVPLG